MTGEITLRGLVLPVGGIKEKVLAARRAGLARVLLPKRNEKDVRDIQPDALEGIEITYVDRMDDVLDRVLEDEALADPAAYFAVPDAEKPRSEGGDGAVGVADPQGLS
jgi:ATP-dependent Lon protease